jgi:hypothetical protein
MTSYYTPTQTHTSSIHDYYYASVSSSSSSVARPLRRSARPSPMAPSLSSSYVGTHAPTRTARPVRPTLSRTPASTPCAISYTPSYASARAHTPCKSDRRAMDPDADSHGRSISPVRHGHCGVLAIVAPQATGVLRRRAAHGAPEARRVRRSAPEAPVQQHVAVGARHSRRL